MGDDLPQGVLLSDDAARDLDELYLASHVFGQRESAASLLRVLGNAFAALEDDAGLGELPPDLLALGIDEYRVLRAETYRLYYRIQDGNACILLIADDKRDLLSLLGRRLLEA